VCHDGIGWIATKLAHLPEGKGHLQSVREGSIATSTNNRLEKSKGEVMIELSLFVGLILGIAAISVFFTNKQFGGDRSAIRIPVRMENDLSIRKISIHRK
jgi:hypothetical protein